MEAIINLPSWTPTPCRRRALLRRRGSGLAVSASGSRDQGGRLVDESMIVLRLRIREMKMLEKKNEEEEEGGCSNWMESEKKYFHGHYGEDVCEAVGLLQSFLMSVRPGLALGMVGLVVLSVLISSGVVLFHSLEMVNAFFSSLYLF